MGGTRSDNLKGKVFEISATPFVGKHGFWHFWNVLDDFWSILIDFDRFCSLFGRKVVLRKAGIIEFRVSLLIVFFCHFFGGFLQFLGTRRLSKIFKPYIRDFLSLFDDFDPFWQFVLVLYWIQLVSYWIQLDSYWFVLDSYWIELDLTNFIYNINVI